MSLDAELDSQPGSPKPVKSELNTCNSGKALDLVAGAYAELSSAFHVIIDLIASQLADGHLLFFDIDHGTCKSLFLSRSAGAWDSHCTAGGPSSYSTAAGASFGIPINPVPGL